MFINFFPRVINLVKKGKAPDFLVPSSSLIKAHASGGVVFSSVTRLVLFFIENFCTDFDYLCMSLTFYFLCVMGNQN